MRYGLSVINFGTYADPHALIELAVEAEGAGWEALFTWDHVAWAWGGGTGPRTGDPWVLLAGVASATSSLIVGTDVTPIPRRRPHILAGQLATLSRLSGGRVVLGAGAGGVDEEFTAFGESADRIERARLLDAGLDVITERLAADEVNVPIWIGGWSGAALRRAARYDGWTAGSTVDEHGMVIQSPPAVAEKVARLMSLREGSAPFDISVAGNSEPGDALVREYEAAGATWWLEGINGMRGSREQMLDRVRAGPPQTSSA